MPQKILILAAHADDEVLGCGGTIARHIAEGDSVSAIFLTDGVGSRKGDASESNRRRSASMEALEALGFSKDKVFGFDLPDNAMDGLPLIEIVRTIQELFDQLTPDVIYTHHPGDLNVDHRAAYDATMVLARPQPGNTVKEIYTFEVASSTGWSGHSRGSAFTPSHYVGIGAYWEKKRKALEAYKDEMRDAPHARSIESLEAQARFRGSQVGLTMAEAFCVERVIV